MTPAACAGSGRCRYRDAHALQHGLFSTHGADDWLLLLEHPHVYTLGVRADPAHVLVDPGRRWAPSWSPPTGAATSPTTARASSSATRS